MYSLHLLGGISLEGPEGPIEGRAAQRRPLALLALLATAENLTASRDRLLGLVWPESPPEKARPRLSVALHGIRKALGSESVITVGDDLRLNTDAVEVDIVGFLDALDREDPERAVELYGGNFLEGFHVRGSPPFERWLDRRQEEYARGYRGALEELAERAEADEAWEEAVTWWRARAAEEPCSSRVAVRLMRALGASGDRPAALRHARVHAAMVKDRLGMEPDPEVRALVERLEKDQLEVEASDGATAPGLAPTARSVDGTGEIPSSGPAEAEAPIPVTDTDGVPSPPLVTGPRLVVAALLLGGLATLAAATVLNEDAPALDSRRVLIDVFENRTGDPALEEMGRMAADWITQGLTYTGFVDVITRGRAILPGQAVPEDAHGDDRGEQLVRIARENGTGTLVWGSLHRSGDSVYFRAHVTDAGDRRELASLEPVAASVDDPVPGLERLRDRAMAALATLTDPRLAKWQEHASRPPTFEAYRTFVDGLELHATQQRFGEAAERFRRAAALDPDFTMAKLWEVMALRSGNDPEEARQILRNLDSSRERLAPLDRAFLDYLVASSLDGDAMNMLRAARQMVEIAPGSQYRKLAGTAALRADRPAEAVRHYERADPETGWLRDWTPYWGGWTTFWGRFAAAHHFLGNYERELALVRRAKTLYPDDLRIRERELRALAALGHLEELESAIADAEGLGGRETGYANRGFALRRAAEDLMAHGHEELGRTVYLRAIEWNRKRLAEEGVDEKYQRLELLKILRAVGELDAADDELELLLAEHPDDPWVLSGAAQLRAQQGRREAAFEFIDRYGEVTGRAGPGLGVTALLGDRETAMHRLREIEQTQGVYRPWLRHTPLLDSLRDYPPFQEFVRPKG